MPARSSGDGLNKQDAKRRSEYLLGQLGLADRATDKIMDLSGGMAQRVQLAAAMVHEPPLLVLDELIKDPGLLGP